VDFHQGLERKLLKELCKIALYVRNKGSWGMREWMFEEMMGISCA